MMDGHFGLISHGSVIPHHDTACAATATLGGACAPNLISSLHRESGVNSGAGRCVYASVERITEDGPAVYDAVVYYAATVGRQRRGDEWPDVAVTFLRAEFDGHPDADLLTPAEIETLRCWVETGPGRADATERTMCDPHDDDYDRWRERQEDAA